jgi:hypothetical protein
MAAVRIADTHPLTTDSRHLTCYPEAIVVE